MALTTVKRQVNPKLGVYYAIFGSAYLSILLLALIAEHMGGDGFWRQSLVVLLPCGLFCVIGLAASSPLSLDYFAAGRRVPAVYNGLSLAISAFGGTGLVALTGCLFLVGFDALCIVIGGLAGFVVMGILLAPFIRKFGAYTIPSYLGARFDSRELRWIAGIVISVPLALMLLAELKMAVLAGRFLTGVPSFYLHPIIAGLLFVSLVAGGTRSMTWVGVAQGIAAVLAILVPVGIVALMWTNLPLPQLSYGPLMRVMARNESLQGLPIILAQGLAFDLPGSGLSSIAKRFATTFSVVSPAGFVASTLTVMMGVAAAPWLLPRIAAAPGVYEARKSLGWATVIFGIVMLTAASIAVFLRLILLENVAELGSSPEWLRKLAAMGFADVEVGGATGTMDQTRRVLETISISRDVALFALPSAAGLSTTFVALSVIGAVAACLSGAAACAVALAGVLSEDLVFGAKAEPPPDSKRLAMVRIALAGVIALASVSAALLPGDSLDMMLWSLTLTGSAFFPVLVLSIWWKTINARGAIAGVLCGLAATLSVWGTGWLDWIEIDPSLASVFGVPAAFVAAVVVSLRTDAPGKHERELLRDIRVPGGEILYDREMRLLRLKKRERTATPSVG